MGGGIGAQPLLHVGERAAAGEVEPKRVETEIGHVPVSVDKPWQERAPGRVDDRRSLGACLTCVQHAQHLAVVADQQACEMLDAAIGVRLDAVGVIDQRVAVGGRGEKRCSEREDARLHAPRLSIVCDLVKR